MPISGDSYDFTEDNVNKAPAYDGVYALYNRNECVYIGKAEGQGGVRSRLQAHHRGANPCTKRWTDRYKRESAHNPSAREKELLEEFRKQYGKLPRCNERAG